MRSPDSNWPLAVALILAMTAAPAALAQDASDDDGPQEQGLTIQATEFIFVEGSLPFVPTSNTIVTKLPLSLQQTPNNVGLVTRALFEQQYGQVLGDALSNVSNLNVQPGFGVFDYFVVRGFDSLSSSLILTDGAPEPESSYYQLYNVELVEVLKGPGGFLYGSNPLAGTVNLVRKQPFANQRFDVGTAFGSFSTFEGTADHNYGSPGGDVAFRVNALYRDTNAYRDNKSSRAAAINPALSWRPSERHSLVGNFEYASSDFTPDAGIPLLFDEIPDVARQNDYNSQFDRSEQNIIRFQLDYQGRLGDRVALRNKLYYRRLDWLSDGTLISGAFPDFGPGFVPTGTVSVYRALIALDDEQEFLGNQFEATLELDTGSVHHDLLAGLELGRFADRFALDVGLLAPVDLHNPQNPPFPPLPLPGQAVAGDARSIVIAPYLIDQISFSDRFQVLAGARLDSIDFRDDLTRRERSDTEVSPMLGAVWLPADALSVYGNFSRSFAPPSPRAFGELKPETSQQVELGIKLQLLDRRAQLTAAVYQLERQNIPIAVDFGFTQQIGNQRSRGFEVEFAAEPGHDFRAVLSYAHNRSELTEFRRLEIVPLIVPIPVIVDYSGNDAVFAPKHLLDLWASKTLFGELGIGLGARYVGEQFIDEDNAFVLPDAVVLSGAVFYDWSNLSISLNVKNLGDTTYYQRGFGPQSITPANPIAAYLRIGYGF